MPRDYASSAIIEPTTDEASVGFSLGHAEVPARLSATGLSEGDGEGTEDETISISTLDGPADIATLAVVGGNELVLSPDNTFIVLTAPGAYRVAKGATADPVGVYLAKG